MNQRRRIIEALQGGAHGTRAISEITGIARNVVQVRVAELLGFGVVSSHAMPSTGRRGRPEKFYMARAA